MIANELDNMTVGHTKIVAGLAVTKWTPEWFEVGTWGRVQVLKAEAIQTLTLANLWVRG